ncbi:hypothetical protein MHJ94_06370 [Chryseobacterium taklimakanense]|uniref:hypothetical protein n=1 Tax=Chryseobacterium taklimakanense TaxID=536441 RepID=UPI001EF48D4A|nr:hypothetical protein [Chryseobacterium taklimakanense]MCG7280921.1 hypothetical protein [Chryseobacterium taklimakanense]
MQFKKSIVPFKCNLFKTLITKGFYSKAITEQELEEVKTRYEILSIKIKNFIQYLKKRLNSKEVNKKIGRG